MERESSFGTHEGPTLENRVLSTKTFTQPLSLFILFIISFILSLGHECLFSNNNTRIKRSLVFSILLFLLFYRATSGVSGNHAVFSCFIFSIIFYHAKKTTQPNLPSFAIVGPNFHRQSRRS